MIKIRLEFLKTFQSNYTIYEVNGYVFLFFSKSFVDLEI